MRKHVTFVRIDDGPFTAPAPLKRPHRLRFITGADGYVYWVVSSSNGKKLYGSTEGYSSLGNASQAYQQIRDAQLSGSVDESALKGKRRAEDTFAVNR
jgi:hypothetical protein